MIGWPHCFGPLARQQIVEGAHSGVKPFTSSLGTESEKGQESHGSLLGTPRPLTSTQMTPPAPNRVTLETEPWASEEHCGDLGEGHSRNRCNALGLEPWWSV